MSPVVLKGYHRDRRPGNAGREWHAEVLSPRQIRALVDEFGHGAAGTRDRAAVLLMYRAGIKPGELLRMERRHYEPGQHHVVVPAGGLYPERRVAIDLAACRALDAWMAMRLRLGIGPTAPLFCVISEPTRGTALYASCLRESLRDRAKSAGIDRRCNPQSLVKSGREHRLASRSRVQMMLGEYLDTEPLQIAHPDAYEKWESAVDLFEAHPVRNAKDIGSSCRQAMELFVDTAMTSHAVALPKDPTPRRRLKAILETLEGRSKTVDRYAHSLVEYWWNVYNLAHRQVHDADREAERTTPSDAQRLIFQTLVVMLEVARLLPEASTKTKRRSQAQQPGC